MGFLFLNKRKFAKIKKAFIFVLHLKNYTSMKKISVFLFGLCLCFIPLFGFSQYNAAVRANYYLEKGVVLWKQDVSNYEMEGYTNIHQTFLLGKFNDYDVVFFVGEFEDSEGNISVVNSIGIMDGDTPIAILLNDDIGYTYEDNTYPSFDDDVISIKDYETDKSIRAWSIDDNLEFEEIPISHLADDDN